MIALIGDVHGKYDRYYKIIRQKDYYPYTVQLGDFGFKYDTVANVDPNCHKILGGNHDNYDKITSVPHYLGDYGNYSLNGVDFFFYRGAYSIDRHYRTIGVDWWEQEELKIEDFLNARELYRKTKPRIVLSHCCPEIIIPNLLPPYSRIYQSRTDWALQELYNIHKPEFWVFGHYHVSKTLKMDTTFICLDELEVLEIK